MAAMGPGVPHYVQPGQPMNIRSPAQQPGGMGMRPQQMMHQQTMMQGHAGGGVPNVVVGPMGPMMAGGQQLPPSLAAAMSSPAGDPHAGGGSAVNSPQMVSSTTGPPSVPSQLQLQHHQMQMQQQQQQQQQMLQQQQRAHDISLDSVTRAKALMAPLKNSLEILIRNAAQNLHQNTSMDLGILRVADKSPERFEKALEEFCALCDEMQLHLIAALETSRAHFRANKYVPLPVNLSKVDNASQPAPTSNPAMDNSLSYPQYLSAVRSQAAYVNDLRKMLMDFSHGLSSA